MNQLVTGHPPVLLCCDARAPEPAEMQHPPFTPAHEAIIGPKHPKLTQVWRWMRLQRLPLGPYCPGRYWRCQCCSFLFPSCLRSQSSPSLLLVSRQSRVDPCSPSDEMPRQLITSTGLAHHFAQFEPRWTRLTGTADQLTLQVSLVFTWAITYQTLPSVGCGANALFVAGLHWAECKVLWHSAPLAASSPPSLGGEGFQKKKVTKKKKKKKENRKKKKNKSTTWRAGYLRPTSFSSRPLLG